MDNHLTLTAAQLAAIRTLWDATDSYAEGEVHQGSPEERLIAARDAMLAAFPAHHPVYSAAIGTSCGERGPQGYYCTDHKDGKHEARTCDGFVCEAWPVKQQIDPKGYGVSEARGELFADAEENGNA